MMALQKILPVAGKFNALIYNIPYVGEIIVRGTSRAIGTLAFNSPLIGGEPSNHIGHVRDQLFKFFGLVGIKPRLVRMYDGEFEFAVDQCPYGFRKEDEKDVCDACMDLDRIYVHHLKARFEIVERIPHGDHHCLFKVSFP